MKKLPSMYEGKVPKNSGNNEKVYHYNSKKEKQLEERNDYQETNLNINQKINKIFKSSTFVYKAKVELSLKSGITTKVIVGKNNSNLITMDNELIPISEIVDIKQL